MLRELEMDPLQTDEALAQRFGVSVQTIRLDRLELGLPEMRAGVIWRSKRSKSVPCSSATSSANWNTRTRQVRPVGSDYGAVHGFCQNTIVRATTSSHRQIRWP